ncbi:MAG: restriction endonuclease subunit S, partial [Thermoguttaceae bacterium]|nr:restriction endonuclease subunit S [Thermoguttaceae bacterium]
MSRIDELIREYCPNGVEYKTIENIATSIFRGSGITRDQVTDAGTPCVRYGEIYTTYGIWFDQCVSHTDASKITSPKFFGHGDILFAITGEKVEEIGKSCAYIGHDNCLAGGDIVVLKHEQNPKYLAYALSTTMAQVQKSKGKVKSKVVHSSVPAIKNITIPVPPLPVQREIVRVLDNFTLLTAELTAELTARKKQYEYYRDMLLSHGSLERNASYATCNEIFELKTGDQLNKTELTETGLYPVYNGGINPSGYHTDYNTEANTIAISQGGASAGYVNYVKTPFWAGAHCYRVMNISPKVNRRFLYFFLKSKQSTLQNSKKGAGIPGLNRQEIYSLSFPLIPLETQEKIAHVLDNFDAICADLNIGLPAEIEARQKQYEYYRDLLLTFAETGTTDRQTDR